jgi:hypothetical protein
MSTLAVIAMAHGAVGREDAFALRQVRRATCGRRSGGGVRLKPDTTLCRGAAALAVLIRAFRLEPGSSSLETEQPHAVAARRAEQRGAAEYASTYCLPLCSNVLTGACMPAPSGIPRAACRWPSRAP